MSVKARVKLPCGAVFTLDDDMRWSSDCPDTVGRLDFQIEIDLHKLGLDPLLLPFTSDCRDIPEILNHQIDNGMADRAYGWLHIPDVGWAEAKRVAKIFDGEIIEFKDIEYPEDDDTVY